MMEKNDEQLVTEYSCQLYKDAIEFVGKRWTGIIIYQLLHGPKRYHELLRAIEGISDRLLTERLKDLENEGLVSKNVLTHSPRKVEYELTTLGYDFKEIFKAIIHWAEKKESLNNSK